MIIYLVVVVFLHIQYFMINAFSGYFFK